LCSLGRITQLKGLQTDDITYTSVMALYWTIIQTNVAAICACIPVLRPAIVLISSKLRDIVSTLQPAFTGLWSGLIDLWNGITGLWSKVTNIWNTLGGLWSKRTGRAFTRRWANIAFLWRPVTAGQGRWPAVRFVVPRPTRRHDPDTELDDLEPVHQGPRWNRSRTFSSLGSVRQTNPEESTGFV